MPYPKTIDTKLEFEQVKELTRQSCLFPLGQQYLEKIRFVNRYDLLEKMLQQVHEFHKILTSDQPFPADHYYDITPYLNKARIEGIWLQEGELHQVRLSVSTFLQIVRYLRDRSGTYPQLESLLEGLLFNDLIIRRVDRILDIEGNLRPNASPELSRLSAKINEKETEIRKRINRMYEKASELGYIAEGIGITIRDGRLVLPVIAEHKRHISGFVHDESNTGQTFYIEPAECFDLNNVLRELQLAYRRERERILLELTDQLRSDIPDLEKNMQRMGLFDFIRAKALVAITMKASLPVLSRHPGLKLVKAYHPLLRLSHDKQGKPTIPLDITLTPESHIVVISGPNAGGKSVCLKTVGLLQYMLQCGFLIPCESHSEVGLFKDILVDIGDEQSIENDLSTYSSHLLHMKYFTDFADAKTLFLIDEFGMGTDPQFGGPLAEAILNQLNQKRAYGVVTTHFSNLKNFASSTNGLLNASMLFDHERMQPLYTLELGKPGSSYAFEIATKTGLNSNIINYARAKVGQKQKRVDDLLVELEKEKHQVTTLREELQAKESRAARLQEQYEKQKGEIETNRKQLIKEAKQEALAIISEANSRVEALIREIKEKQADSESQRKARTEIREQLKDLKETVKEIAPATPVEAPAGGFKPGDLVKIEGQEATGEIIEITKNKALISIGELRTTVELSRLLPVARKPGPKKTKAAPQGIDMNEKMQHFNTELNLIGTRGEDALKQLQLYIDDAYLLGFRQVRIIHGRGYGILRKLIREYLSKSKFVDRAYDEHVDRGGDAITIVDFK